MPIHLVNDKGRYRQFRHAVVLQPSLTPNCRLKTMARPWQLSGLETRSAIVEANVFYHSLLGLASPEVNFWFTCRRKHLVAQRTRVAKGAG